MPKDRGASQPSPAQPRSPKLEAAIQAAAVVFKDALRPEAPAPRRRRHSPPAPDSTPETIPAHLRAPSPPTRQPGAAVTRDARAASTPDPAAPAPAPRLTSPPSVSSAKSADASSDLRSPPSVKSVKSVVPSRRGPNTPEGKATVAGNAITHGITANTVVIPGVESEEEWKVFRDRFIEAFAPGSDAERIVLDRAALLRWRIRRVERMEAESVAVAIDEVDEAWRKSQSWSGRYPSSVPAARAAVDRARSVLEVVERLPDLPIGYYIEAPIGDAVVANLAGEEEDGVESFRGALATGTQLMLAAKKIAAGASVTLEEVLETGLLNARDALAEAEEALDYVDTSIGRMKRRARILPEAALYALSRHEAQLDRAFHRSMTQFESLKAAREGRPIPLARLQVHA